MDDATERALRPNAALFQLRFGAIFARVALVVWIVGEVLLWLKLRDAGFPFRPRYRRFLVMLYFTPRLAFRAMAAGALVAIGADLAFRVLVRPLMRRWYDPRPRDPHWTHPHPFFQKVGERVLGEFGARQVASGRSRPAGTLIVSDCGLTFYPFAWDREPWFLPKGHLRGLTTRTPARRVLGLVRGYPDNLVVSDDAGEETAFVVADPRAVMDALGGCSIAEPQHVARA